MSEKPDDSDLVDYEEDEEILNDAAADGEQAKSKEVKK